MIHELRKIKDFRELLKNSPKKILIIKWWQVGCSPCAMLEPVINEVAINNDALLISVDISKFSEISNEFKVQVTPTIDIRINDEWTRHEGYADEEFFNDLIKSKL